MKPLPKILLGLGLSLCLLSGAVASERYALVVGNGDYAFSPLKNPTNDAFDMAVALRQVGFSVRHLENATRRELRKEIHNFSNDLSKDDVGLFYYSGHGVQSNNENFLIPIGAEIQAEYMIEDEAVGVRTVLGAMEASGSRLNIVVLDACRDNPFRQTFRSVGRGLAIVHAPRGTLVAFSTAPGQVAADGAGRNSPYTKHLLAALAIPNLAIEQVFKKVRVEVGRDTAGAQTPWEESSLMGDFYFTGESEQTATISPTTTQPDQSAEVAFWQSIEDSNDPEMYQAYLTEFPDGKFVLLAKIKLKNLEPAVETIAEEPKATEETVTKEEPVAEELTTEGPAEGGACIGTDYRGEVTAGRWVKWWDGVVKRICFVSYESSADAEARSLAAVQAQGSAETGTEDGVKNTRCGCDAVRAELTAAYSELERLENPNPSPELDAYEALATRWYKVCHPWTPPCK